MKQICIEHGTITAMMYDPESEKFKNALKNYQNMLVGNVNEKDMLRYIAQYISKLGDDVMIDGIGGFVAIDGKIQGGSDNWCGVDIVSNFDIKNISNISIV